MVETSECILKITEYKERITDGIETETRQTLTRDAVTFCISTIRFPAIANLQGYNFLVAALYQDYKRGSRCKKILIDARVVRAVSIGIWGASETSKLVWILEPLRVEMP